MWFFYNREWNTFAFFLNRKKASWYIKPLEINCNQILPNFLFSKFKFLEFELWNIIWMIFPLCHVLWCNSKLTAVVWVNLSWSLGGVSNFCSNQTKCGETIYEKAFHKGLWIIPPPPFLDLSQSFVKWVQTLNLEYGYVT